MRKEKLPEFCYAVHPGLDKENKIIMIYRGEEGYYPKDNAINPEEAQSKVDDLNMDLGITKNQVESMLAGSMFGWDVPAANPQL